MRAIYIFLITWIVFLTSCSENVQESTSGNTPAGISSSEDPYARINYEKLKVIDPKTGEIPENIRARELNFINSLSEQSRKSSSVNWNSRGPYNVGGRTRAMAFDANDESIILAGGVTGGMWRSDNGGLSFVKTTTPDQFQSVTCVAQDTRPGKRNVWYYGTGEYYGVISAASFSNQASGNGIFKSVDGGNSWQMLQSTVSNTPTTLYENGDFDFVWNIVTDHTDTSNDAVYAAVINGIYRSLDGGLSWAAVLGLDTNNNSISRYSNVIITSEGIFYAALNAAGAAGGIWRSTDGDNWVNITPANFPNSYRRTVMAAAPSDENQVYFLSETPNSGALDHNLWHYTYISGDGSGAGGSWDNRTANLPDYKCQVFYDFTFGSYNSQSSYDMCIAVQAGNPDHVFIGGTDVFRSTDGFTSSNNHSWIGGYQCDTVTPSNYIYPNHHPDQHVFLFLPSDSSVLFTASDGGVHKTLDCLAPSVNWISLNNGYVTSQFYTVTIEPGEVSNDILIGGMQDNGTFFTNSSDPNQLWENVFYGDGAYAAIEEGRNNYYLSWQTGKVFKFKIDDGGNVLGKTRIDPLGASDFLFINPFILDPTDNNIMYLAAGRYIWKNDDLDSIPITGNETTAISDHWGVISESITPFGSRISALSMPSQNGNLIYYGTTSGRVYRLDSLQNGTLGKEIITPPDAANGAYLSSVAVLDNVGDEILVSYSNYEVPSIFYSNDRGVSWEDVSSNLEENPDGSGDGPSVMWVSSLSLADSTIYFAGTSVGLFSAGSLDSNQTNWKLEGENTIGNSIINMIQSRESDGLVAVATHGNGIFSARYKNITGVEEQNSSNIQLSAHPNPFDSYVRIEATLANSERAFLRIADISGKTVFSTALETSSPQQVFNWQGRDDQGASVPAGMYIITIESGLTTNSKKVIKM